jgi:hypothetical protein
MTDLTVSTATSPTAINLSLATSSTADGGERIALTAALDTEDLGRTTGSGVSTVSYASGPGVFSMVGSSPSTLVSLAGAPQTQPFSLSLVETVQFTSPGSIVLDSSIDPSIVPEPSTLALFGTALPLVGFPFLSPPKKPKDLLLTRFGVAGRCRGNWHRRACLDAVDFAPMIACARLKILTGLAIIAMVGCLDPSRLVPSLKEGINAETRAEEVARVHLENVYGKSLHASFILVIRREDGYFVLVNFHRDYEGRSDDRDFATIVISTDWEVLAVDYTNERRRLKDPMAIATEDRENALPAQTTERLIRQAIEQGVLPPPQTGAE